MRGGSTGRRAPVSMPTTASPAVWNQYDVVSQPNMTRSFW